VIRLGVIGLNEGNGHPFSFSAIVNGYSDDGFARSGWPVIHDYLKRRDPEDIGLPGVSVTHAWTQDPEMTRRLCAASLIENATDRREDMIGKVDGVLLARHDHEKHFEMAMPFLEAGMWVLVDKPLSLEPDELTAFLPYLASGKLMSCSALRYAPELDGLRGELPDFGRLKLIQATVCLDWTKYGIHMVDAILSLGLPAPVEIEALRSNHESFQITLADDTPVRIDALGLTGVTFQFDVFGERKRASLGLYDNFSSFKRCLEAFVSMIKSGKPAVPPETTLLSMAILRAGLGAQGSSGAVEINPIEFDRTEVRQ
jgi:predicted dehydrogenase